MKRSIQALICLIVFFLMTGCAYLNVQVPLDTNFNKTELGTKEGNIRSKVLFMVILLG